MKMATSTILRKRHLENEVINQRTYNMQIPGILKLPNSRIPLSKDLCMDFANFTMDIGISGISEYRGPWIFEYTTGNSEFPDY